MDASLSDDDDDSGGAKDERPDFLKELALKIVNRRKAVGSAEEDD